MLRFAIVTIAGDEDYPIKFVLTNADSVEQAQAQLHKENPDINYEVIDILQFRPPENSARMGARTASYDALHVAFEILRALSGTISGAIIIETLLTDVFSRGMSCRNGLVGLDNIQFVQSLLRPE